MKQSKIILAAFLSLSISSGTYAATVPPGTKLAADQTFTYRVLDEFSSFDPQVVEDVNGSEVVRDLFEGLYNQDADGNNVPGVALRHVSSPCSLMGKMARAASPMKRRTCPS